MKQIKSALWQASLLSGLSQLQLWILIQSNIIKSTYSHQEITIDMNKLREWIFTNNRTVGQLQLRVDERDPRFSLEKNLKKWKK